jgi:REP element-mobilizing transposase RayT
MSRQLRLEYPGAIYHVTNRGNQRNKIFRNDGDRELFLSALEEACRKTGWQVHAFCLMDNHFHLVVETPEGNLVAGMKWWQGVYTKRYNIRHKTCGHLFAGRYKSLVVDGSGNGYLRTVCDYVHLNPVRAKLIRLGEPLESFRWSSYGQYLKPPKARLPWMRVDRLLGEKRIRKESGRGRVEFAREMEGRRRKKEGAEYAEVRRGWCLGSVEFRRELLARVEEGTGPNHYGLERQESGEEKAQRMVAEGLRRLGWGENELRRRAKGDKEKVKLARELRERTTMTLAWIAKRLEMGRWPYVSNLLRDPALKKKGFQCQK